MGNTLISIREGSISGEQDLQISAVEHRSEESGIEATCGVADIVADIPALTVLTLISPARQ